VKCVLELFLHSLFPCDSFRARFGPRLDVWHMCSRTVPGRIRAAGVAFYLSRPSSGVSTPVCLPHTSLLRASRARRIRHSTCLRNSEHRVCDNILFRRFLSCTSICTFTFGSSVGAHFHGTGTGSSHFLDRFEPIFGFLLFDTRLASFFLQSSCHCFATLYTS
jgi:hypothetical protein